MYCSQAPQFRSLDEYEEYINAPPMLIMQAEPLLPSLCQTYPDDPGDISSPIESIHSPSPSPPQVELTTEEYVWKKPSHNSNEFRGNAFALITAHCLQIQLEQFKKAIRCPRKKICTKGYVLKKKKQMNLQWMFIVVQIDCFLLEVWRPTAGLELEQKV